MNQIKRIGVIGLGRMGSQHCRIYSGLRRAQLVGVTDANPEVGMRLAQRFEVPFYPTVDELLDHVDAVSLVTPTPYHYALALKCLERGIHVLIEKPITETEEQAAALVLAAEKSGLVVQVGHIERFNPALSVLRELSVQPRFIESQRLAPFTYRALDVSVIMDLMIHDIDIALGLVDSEPRKITAVGASVHSTVTDVANVQIVFDTGTIATITASRATEEKIRTLAITQPEAYIVLDYSYQDIQIHRRAAQEYTLNRESIRYRQASFVEHLLVHKDNPLKLEIRHLISAVRAAQMSGQVELPEAEDLRSLAVSLEIERMIREGRGETAWSGELPWSVPSP